MTLRVLSVASECHPFVKTGGLGDVIAALPAALAPHGVSVTTLIPGYPTVMQAFGDESADAVPVSLFGVTARLLRRQFQGHGFIIVDAPVLFDRPGGPYGDPRGHDWPDNWRRFGALGRIAADLAAGEQAANGGYDILHAHDWQAGLAPAYVRYAYPGARVATVATIHNIAFQGRFDRSTMAPLGLPRRAWHIDGVEYHGGVGFLKAALSSADAITTVSPRYAREIATPPFGFGLDGLIRARGAAVSGILNGIDTTDWNPATDAFLHARFDAATIDRRLANKRAIEQDMGLVQDDGPLFIAITRLADQKGIDLLVECLDRLVERRGRLALLGSGDPVLEAAMADAARRHPGRIAVRIGFDEGLSHRLQAGGDCILIPSRFEPCGLTQLYGLAYGCVPLVSRTGGLADTVVDAAEAAGTGITFDPVTADALSHAIDRAIDLYAQPGAWRAMQARGMTNDFSWSRSGAHYADLYRALAQRKAG